MPGSPLPRRLALAAAFLALAAAPAAAQVREVRLVLDNDAYDFWTPKRLRPDHDYTNGVDLRMELAGAPGWARWVAPRAPSCSAAAAGATCARTTLRFGQKIFTPRYTLDEEPNPGQRPYAGWLYLAAATRVESERASRSIGVEAGVTGKPSLAEAVQTAWHRLAGFYPPEGWQYQLGFEPDFAAQVEESRLVEARAGETRVAAIVPTVAADAGTLHVGARVSVDARAGYAVPHPWRGAAKADPPVSLYALARVQQAAVARDLFLDGSTWRSSVRAERIPFVAEREVGIGARFRGFTAEYRSVRRGREYEAQEKPHTWSTFELGFRLR